MTAILNALIRGRSTMADKELTTGALFSVDVTDMNLPGMDGRVVDGRLSAGGTDFLNGLEEIPNGRFDKVVGVCALGALYLGLAEAKKDVESAAYIADDAACMLAIGVIMSDDRARERWEEEYERYVEDVRVYDGLYAKVLDFNTWLKDHIDPSMAREIVPELNDDTGDKDRVLAAFDAAIDFARSCGL